MKKLSVTKQVLNLLNTKGGRKPKQIIAETKASAGSVYNALNLLRGKKMIAKEEDGVYISQTQTSTSSPSTTKDISAVAYRITKGRGRPRKAKAKTKTTAKRMPLYHERSSGNTDNILKENQQLTEWTLMWKQKYDRLEQDYTQAKVMYLDSQAVVAYLEEKVAQLLRG